MVRKLSKSLQPLFQHRDEFQPTFLSSTGNFRQFPRHRILVRRTGVQVLQVNVLRFIHENRSQERGEMVASCPICSTRRPVGGVEENAQTQTGLCESDP